MLIRPPADIRPSEITDRRLYMRRREFMVGAAAIGAAAMLPAGAHAATLAAAKSPLSTDEKPTPLKDVTHYNNFYEFGVNKTDPAANAHTLKTKPWKVKVDGLARQARRLRPRRSHQGHRAGGAHLPDALRRRLVDGHPVDRRAAGERAQARRSAGQRQVRRLRDAGASLRDVRPARPLPAAQLALCGGPQAGRGHAPAHHPGGRSLWREAAQPERRADPAGGALEVRLQGHQIDRAHQPGGEAAADDLESGGPQRVRLLFQRQSRPSTIRAGARPPSAASAAAGCSPSARRRCPSTAMPIRWRASMPAWT